MKGIEGMKRQKQNEFLLLAALCYICTQLLCKSILYFVVTSTNGNVSRDKGKVSNVEVNPFYHNKNLLIISEICPLAILNGNLNFIIM